MGKVKQRNWLLLATGLLFVFAAVILINRVKESNEAVKCYYEGEEYSKGEFISDYGGRSDCFCSSSGIIQCEDSEVSMSYESFTSQNLQFSYTFLNYLEKESPDLTKIILSDIDHGTGQIEITLQREAFCREDSIAPTQVGLYEKRESSLVITTITNRDETIYSEVCSISNVFVISSFDLSENSGYSLLYQNESGQLFDLNACFFNGKLYSTGDVFKDRENDKLCSCNGPEIECESL